MRSVRNEYPISLVLLIGAVVLQSTILNRIRIVNIIPDLSLIILVYISYRKGCMTGQVTGFVSGLIEDILSISPLGLSTFIKTLIGYLYGLMEGNIFVDPLLMPIILVASATLLKALIMGALSILFPIPQITLNYYIHSLWISILYNSLLAPFIFAVLNLLKALKPREKGLQ